MWSRTPSEVGRQILSLSLPREHTRSKGRGGQQKGHFSPFEKWVSQQEATAVADVGGMNVFMSPIAATASNSLLLGCPSVGGGGGTIRTGEGNGVPIACFA